MTPTERFLAKVAKTDGCWLWTGTKVGIGYGRFKWNRFSWRAHRAAWALFRGEIPYGMNVLHKCDVPACVNPDHLFLGTTADNVADKMAKGRHATAHGERAGGAKLTDAKVRVIRRLGKRGVMHRVIAAHFGVCRTVITQVIGRKIWAHVGDRAA